MRPGSDTCRTVTLGTGTTTVQSVEVHDTLTIGAGSLTVTSTTTTSLLHNVSLTTGTLGGAGSGCGHVVTDSSGARTTVTINPDGTATLEFPDGSVARATQGPDPRWGMQVPLLASASLSLPSGAMVSAAHTRTVTLTDPANPLSVSTQTETRTVGGRTTTTTYDRAAGTIDVASPAGRHRVLTLNALGQVVSTELVRLWSDLWLSPNVRRAWQPLIAAATAA